MTQTLAFEATTRADLGSIPWINQGYLPFSFNFVSGKGEGHASRPLVEPSVPSSTTPFALSKFEVLKDEDGTMRYPLHKLLGGGVAEVPSAASLTPVQTFESPSNGLGTLPLYLSGLKLFKPSFCLSVALVLDFLPKPGPEELPPIRINGNDGIGLVEIDPNRMNALGFWNLEGHSDVADKLAISHLNCHAIDFFGVIKERLEVFGNLVVKSLSAVNCPDGKCAIFPKISIPSPFANEEKPKRLLELDRLLDPVSVGLGSGISPSNESYGRAGELAGESSLDRIIGSPMRRDPVADLGEAVKRCPEVAVWLYDYLCCSLDSHRSDDTAITKIYQVLLESVVATPSRLKATVPSQRFLWAAEECARTQQKL